MIAAQRPYQLTRRAQGDDLSVVEDGEAIAIFGLVESSWHTLAQAQAYATQPGKSGVVLSVTSLISPVTSFLPLLVGVIAAQAGLGWGLAALLAGPTAAGILLITSR